MSFPPKIWHWGKVRQMIWGKVRHCLTLLHHEVQDMYLMVQYQSDITLNIFNFHVKKILQSVDLMSHLSLPVGLRW